MAHLWTTTEEAGDWIPKPFQEFEASPAGNDSQRAKNPAGHVQSAGQVMNREVTGAAIVRADEGQNANWLLVVEPTARVFLNGATVPVGIAQLSEKDEIMVVAAEGAPVRRFYFSDERLACIEPLLGSEAVSCPRCKLAINPGDPAVQCPSCHVWHHQDPDAGKPCWTYAEKCAACHTQTTAMDAGYSWSPEELCGC